MLDALRLGSGWEGSTKVFGNATIGWTGWRAPKLYASDGLVVVLDGSIYNRAELGAYKSDSELLAALYRRHGFVEMLLRLNGDYAIAIYDVVDDALWLARDRFGNKPLYYAVTAHQFVFASQPRGLLKLPSISWQVNRQFVALFAASHYRYFDNNPDASPYADIAQLPAAHYLCLRGDVLRKHAYWVLDDLPDFDDTEDDLAERYRDLLVDAVSLRLKSAEKPAFTLSGGMDSSSVLASAVRISGEKQHAFSTVYSDATYDETDEIRSMLDSAVEKWHAVQVENPDVFELVRQMVEIHDEPVATATWLSHYLLCQETAALGFEGLFGGLGGDELNAGEYEYFFYYFADLRTALADKLLNHEIEKWIENHDHPIFRKSQTVYEDGLARIVDLRQPGRCLPERNRMTRYYHALDRGYYELDSFEPAMDHPFQSYLKNRTFQDIFRETAPCCLRAEDRQTMAFNLDNFLPFFDHRLTEFMFRISGHLKIRDGRTKHLLRKATRGILPEETRRRIKKTGWNAPAHIWFSNQNQEQLLDLIHSQSFRQRGIYNLTEVEAIVQEHHEIVSSGEARENHMMFLWQLINLETWLEIVTSPKLA